MHLNLVEILLKRRFWFSRWGWGTQILRFWQFPGDAEIADPRTPPWVATVVHDTGLGVSGGPCLFVRWFSCRLCFHMTFYFESTLGFSMLPKAEWKGGDSLVFSLVLLIQHCSVWFSLYWIFLGPVLLFILYSFSFTYHFQIVAVLLSHSVTIFFFPLLSLVLEILFRCLGWLLVPVVFLLLPKIFCERSTEIGHRRL